MGSSRSREIPFVSIHWKYIGGKSYDYYCLRPGEIERKWYVIDAAGKPLGRVAAQAAVLLRGKHKVTFAPHVGLRRPT